MLLSVTDPVFQRLVTKLHSLAPRVMGELLAEIAREISGDGQWPDEAWLVQRLETFAAIQPEALAATGFDKWPPLPILAVPSDDVGR